jgi:rhodanese-related sulfurtransferase
MDAPGRTPRNGLLAPMAGMLLLAVALGLAYNSLSPLGTESGTGIAAPQPAPPPRAGSLSGSSVGSTTPPAIPAHIVPVPGESSPEQPSGQIRVVKWMEIKAQVESGILLLIDARPAASYQLNHIPGAISIPPETSEADFLRLMAEYPKSRPIAVYCASESCHVSRALAQHLASLGFSQVNDMQGGMAEYLRGQQELIK